jgi:hypothetical protein
METILFNNTEVTEQGTNSNLTVATRKSGRITDNFEFHVDNVLNGKNEMFNNINDLILYYVKSYDGKVLSDYIKIIQPKNGRMPYKTLRIPKQTVKAAYTKLKLFMVIKKEQATTRKHNTR